MTEVVKSIDPCRCCWHCRYCIRPREASGLRAGLGLVGLAAVIALAVSPLLIPVEKDFARNEGSRLSAHQYESMQIRGSMTLREIEQATGVPAAYIIESLNLPDSTSLEERLGSLKREHGFEIHDVREAAKAYINSK
jgi:hypothetical protein